MKSIYENQELRNLLYALKHEIDYAIRQGHTDNSKDICDLAGKFIDIVEHIEKT